MENQEKGVKENKPVKNKNKLMTEILWMLLAFTLGLLIGWFVFSGDDTESIQSYEDCVNAGYPVLESFPEQCTVDGGDTYVRDVSEDDSITEDPSGSTNDVVDSDDEAVVVFSPAGTFTDTEKQMLTEMVVDPLVDWYVDTGVNVLTILINDLIYADIDDAYEYSFDVISNDGTHLSFLFTEMGEEIDWWKPDCLNECQFSAEYKEKYPEVVN